MPDEPSDEEVLKERARLLAFARTDAAFAPRVTITPRTWLQATAVADEATTEVPSSDAELTLDPITAAGDLPRITLDDRDSPLDGQLLARSGRPDYAILSTLGEGGMGRVHLARQRSLARDVALKTLKPDASRAVAIALLREARLTGSLEHPGVIPVHLLGLDDTGRPMLVMKRVDGVDLGALLGDPSHGAWRAPGRASDRLVASLEILMQVCLTLAFAHHRGVIHRDIKPENIMVGAFGEVYLLDWGIATSKDDQGPPGALVGTPAYMAPEMVRGAGVDERTDVYLLGATLHHVLVGVPRHDGKTLMDVVRAALVSDAFSYGADVPAELAALANRATSRDPALRPESAEAFRDELGDFLKHRSARALAEIAVVRVSELEEALAAAGDSAPTDIAAAYRLATEARFGLVESLREHADGEEAQGAMDRCLAASIELELRQGNADAAEALLREVRGPRAAIEKRIAETRARKERAAQAGAALERIERDLDPSVHGAPRVLLILGLAVISLSFGLYVSLGIGGDPTPRTILGVGIAAFACISVGLAIVRKLSLIHI